ncbi:MAG TPA: FtsX-like permease family protein [Ornithinibacter sp.]|nr:FtsX-like permease family protein [Ornithinibacter sp.]
MGVGTLLRRRLLTHPVALVAVATSVLMSMVVVATLQLLSSAIADASVRTTLDVPGEARSVALTAGLRPGELVDVDQRVRAAVGVGGPDAVVTRTSTATSRGIEGRADTDRARLADVSDLEQRARLVEGAWPTAPSGDVGAGRGSLEVVLPTSAADALGTSVGARLALTDLVDRAADPLTVVVTGTYEPTGVEDGLWVDDPLGLSGVARSDFTTYGPFLTADGALDRRFAGPSTATWRWLPGGGVVTTADLPGVRAQVEGVLDGLRRTAGIRADGAADPAGALGGPPLRDARVGSGLPDLLDRAALVSERVRVSLLTPTVLLVVLGTASLVVAAALLASLRDAETRLMRTRGASTGQLGVLALADAALVVVLGGLGAVLLAPVLSTAVARTAGLDLGDDGVLAALTSAPLWGAVVPMALLATVVIVATTVRVGRVRDGVGSRQAGRVVRLLTGSGLDVLLVGLGALAVVQLRRYDAAGATTVDPLTTAAPAVVIAGLSVLCLRLLPVLTRQVSRVTGEARGLEPAWGGWQLSRRLSGQAGTVLLVLLAVAMGTLALSHSATADRAVEDQSAFETGSPVRVVVGRGAAAPGTSGPLLAQAAGGADRVVPVARDVVDIGALTGVTALALDAESAARVVDPRADTLAGATWPDLLGRLARARRLAEGVALPGEPARVTLRAGLDTPVGEVGEVEGVTVSSSVLLRDARGLVSALPLGELGSAPRDLTIDLPTGDRRMAYPLTLLGVTARAPEALVDAGTTRPTFTVALESVTADGVPVAGLEVLTERSRGGDLLRAGAAADLEALPAVVTRSVADAARADVGSTLALTFSGRRLPLTVVGVVDSVPTARVPDRAVVVDLPTVLAVGDVPTAERRPSTRVVEPQEWWVDPVASASVVDAVRTGMPAGTAVVVRPEVVAERAANPVNAGMRAAMSLVTAAALVLAAVGFAATTVALGRTRRRENAVLLALGMPPGRIRRVLALERVGVVVLSVAVGLVLGVLSSWAVVPVLVGGDGHPQVPAVLVSLPAAHLLGFGVVVALVLSAVGILVLRDTGREVAAVLRHGEAT